MIKKEQCAQRPTNPCVICTLTADLQGLPIAAVCLALQGLSVGDKFRCRCGIMAGMHAIAHPHRLWHGECQGYVHQQQVPCPAGGA